jgi:hypothetical protein
VKFTFVIALVCLLFAGCGSDDVEGPDIPDVPETAFGDAEMVNMEGYDGDIMEPFLSRDGQYLFFNDMGEGRDIYFATYNPQSDDFTFQSSIAVVNTPSLEGVPTLDSHNRFYYISTYNYPPNNANIFDTIYVGDFDAGSASLVENLAVVPNLDVGILGHLNFDVEVNPEGTVLYFVDGVFSGNPYPDVSNFVYAVDAGSGFVRQADSADVFANINTDELEYAACISSDGLEFFFTRLELATLETALFQSTRPSVSDAFSTPQQIDSISGFVEAPTLSPDEKVLYFHRKNPVSNIFELYRVRRP